MGSVRLFESGIFHFTTALLGGNGADDGATDILLVGMDSRTDAHGNPLSPRNSPISMPATRPRPIPSTR
jgi:hypothetical protein